VAFEAVDVPVEVSGAAGFRESPAVRVLATLLGALSDPNCGNKINGGKVDRRSPCFQVQFQSS
jgi:hypothetical protein